MNEEINQGQTAASVNGESNHEYEQMEWTAEQWDGFMANVLQSVSNAAGLTDDAIIDSIDDNSIFAINNAAETLYVIVNRTTDDPPLSDEQGSYYTVNVYDTIDTDGAEALYSDIRVPMPQ